MWWRDSLTEIQRILLPLRLKPLPLGHRLLVSIARWINALAPVDVVTAI